MDSHRPPVRHPEDRAHARRPDCGARGQRYGDHGQGVPRGSPAAAASVRRVAHRDRHGARGRSAPDRPHGRAAQAETAPRCGRFAAAPAAEIEAGALGAERCDRLHHAASRCTAGRERSNGPALKSFPCVHATAAWICKLCFARWASAQILNLMIEAGAELNGAALESGIVDKMVLFYAPKIIGNGGVPMARMSPRGFAKSPALQRLTVNHCGSDFVVQGYFHDVYGNHGTRRKD